MGSNIGSEGGDFKCKKKRAAFWGSNGKFIFKVIIF